MIHISICNLNPNEPTPITCELRGMKTQAITGQILTSDDMTAHNTFQNPDTIKPTEFVGASLENNTLKFEIPAKSVVVLEVR